MLRDPRDVDDDVDDVDDVDVDVVDCPFLWSVNNTKKNSVRFSLFFFCPCAFDLQNVLCLIV